MKKLLFLFIFITSIAKAQNDSIVLFLFSDNNNNGIYETGMGEKPIINYCLSMYYKHIVASQGVWSNAYGRTDLNGKCRFLNLGVLSTPDSNIVSPSAAFPSDIMYNNVHISQIKNLPKTVTTQIPLYSVFGFKHERAAGISTVNSPGSTGQYQNFCIGTSSLVVVSDYYSRNYVDINPGFIPINYTVTNGVTTNTYNEVMNFNWPANGISSCGALGAWHYIQPIPELSTVGIYTITFADATNFSNWGWNDGFPYTQTMKIIVDSCTKIIGNNTYVECSNDCYKGVSEYFSTDEVITSTNGTYTTTAIPDYNGNYNVLSPYSATPYTLTAIPNPGFSHTCTSIPTTTYMSTSWSGNITRYDQLAQTTTSNVNCYAFINSPIGSTAPGSVFNIQPYYSILNPDYCSILNHTGKFWVKLSPEVTFQSLSVTTPSYTTLYPSATGDSIVWNIADLRTHANNMTGHLFDLNLLMKTTSTVGNSYCFKAGVSSLYPETSFTDNKSSDCWIIGGPYDPNHKEVMPEGISSQGFIPTSTTELYYTIHFQNVGNGPAINVKIKDLLDSDLDKSSLKILGSSAPVQTNIDGTGLVTFLFDNIILIDSLHDEPHSHGFVSYKINLNPSLSAGTQINNTASIYFDYNAPIITNTTLNTLQTATGVQSIYANDYSIYPNPNKGLLTITSNEIMTKINVLNVLGQTVKTQTVDANKTTLDISDLVSNVYFIQITDSKNQVSIHKIIKE